MLDRTQKCFGLKPKRLAADTAYGTGKFLGWLVKVKKIIPHIPVWEKSDRQDGIFSRSDFRWDRKRGVYICPNGKLLQTSGTVHDGRTLLYRASKRDWIAPAAVIFKSKCMAAEYLANARRGIVQRYPTICDRLHLSRSAAALRCAAPVSAALRSQRQGSPLHARSARPAGRIRADPGTAGVLRPSGLAPRVTEGYTAILR